MRRTLLAATALCVGSLTIAPAASAQPVVSDSVEQAVQRLALPARIVEIRLDPRGVMHVELEAPELEFDRILHQEWPAYRISTRPEDRERTTEQAGREIAQALLRGTVARGVEEVQVVVRSTDPSADPTRVRLRYPADARSSHAFCNASSSTSGGCAPDTP